MATANTHPDNDPIAGEESSGEAVWFYQCTSPECNLRFPAPLKADMVCPICKSEIYQVKAAGNYQSINPPFYEPVSRFSVLLDNLRSAYNVGSILRTADGAGIQHAYLCGITPTPLHPRLAKTALSAEIHTSWSHHLNGVELVHTLRQSGYFIIGLETTGNACDIFSEIEQPFKKCVLVVGNEICGIDPAIIDQCDKVFSLPMLGIKNSLNVAVSFGIASYHLIFNRTSSPPVQSGNP